MIRSPTRSAIIKTDATHSAIVRAAVVAGAAPVGDAAAFARARDGFIDRRARAGRTNIPLATFAIATSAALDGSGASIAHLTASSVAHLCLRERSAGIRIGMEAALYSIEIHRALQDAEGIAARMPLAVRIAVKRSPATIIQHSAGRCAGLREHLTSARRARAAVSSVTSIGIAELSVRIFFLARRSAASGDDERKSHEEMQ